ncbi:hypothetical protein QAD02_021826 [Eretmocerus hayati]|uniref:Uncharacterized protein n=1 Tax=Eretmocerus hayati TaxID=131215 RepID=A0ACC2PRB4_9HYME|nr:hypothetical protein QAD02_021826 [Eretmocerus hayati]
MTVAYGFCKTATRAHKLVACIEEVVKLLKKAGLHPVATDCDQGTFHVQAIRILLDETETVHGTIYVEGVELVPVLDVYKCLRNLLMKHFLEINRKDGKLYDQRCFVSCLVLQISYEIDLHGKHVRRYLSHLNDEHIYEHKMKKMRVKHAVQALGTKSADGIEIVAMRNRERVMTNLGEREIPRSQVAHTVTTFHFFWLASRLSEWALKI